MAASPFDKLPLQAGHSLYLHGWSGIPVIPQSLTFWRPDTLEDGTRVKCKRRGLKISLAVGDKKGDGLMRRIEVSRDPVAMLEAALAEAARAADVVISTADGAMYLERP